MIAAQACAAACQPTAQIHRHRHIAGAVHTYTVTVETALLFLSHLMLCLQVTNDTATEATDRRRKLLKDTVIPLSIHTSHVTAQCDECLTYILLTTSTECEPDFCRVLAVTFCVTKGT